MMRERRIRNLELFLKFTNHQPLRMRRQQQLHNPETRLRPHRRKHIGVTRYLIPRYLLGRTCHISIFAEIWNLCQAEYAAPAISRTWERPECWSRLAVAPGYIFVKVYSPAGSFAG